VNEGFDVVGEWVGFDVKGDLDGTLEGVDTIFVLVG
jgi:hypothetical protein